MLLIGLFLFFVCLPSGIAWALSSGLARMMPNSSLRRRTAIAAITAGLVPVALPIFVVAAESADSERSVAVAALLFCGFVAAILIGLPVALYVGRSLEMPRPDPKAFD